MKGRHDLAHRCESAGGASDRDAYRAAVDDADAHTRRPKAEGVLPEAEQSRKRFASLQAAYALRGAQLLPSAAGFVILVGGITRHAVDLDACETLLAGSKP